MLPFLSLVGRSARRGLQSTNVLQWTAVAGGIRTMGSLPAHTVMGMPSLSPTMDKGNIASWKVKEGDTIAPGTVLADIETDKATMAFESQDDGVIAKVLMPDGSKDVPIGSPLLVVVESAEDVAAFKDYKTGGSPPAAASSTAEKDEAPAAGAEKKQTAKPAGPANHRIGPAARLLLEEAGLSLSDVTPTGPNSIITKGDVLAAMEAGRSGKPAAQQQAAPQPAAAAPARTDKESAPTAAATEPPKPKPSQQPPTAPGQTTAPAQGAGANYTDIPTTQIRRIIAQRLLESKVQIPSLYASTDVQLDALLTLRKTLAEQGVKLSINDFILKAVALALKEVPAANCLWDAKKGEAVPAPGIDISVAVATDRGLITPIVKAADQKSLTQISSDVRELAAKAKANKLKPEEFQGGSFTVSNLGMYGTTFFSAIINPPQGAIMAVGSTQQVTRLANGKPVATNVMTVTLSCDHRMYDDGELVGKVLSAFKKHMEEPIHMML